MGGNVGLEEKDFLRETYATQGLNFYDPAEPDERDQSKYKQDHRITKYKNYGIYAQDTVHLNEFWTVMGGLRYTRQDADLDYVSKSSNANQSADAFVSQAGIVYKIFAGTSLYASYGESFNPNSVEDKDSNGNGFDPEEGRQYEIGTKSNIFTDKTNLTLAYFDIKKSNLVEENIYTGENELLGEIKSTGVEAELLAMPLDNWQIKLGYAYVDSKISANPDQNIQGNQTPLSARHDAYFWTRYNLPYRIQGGVLGSTLGVNYESARYTASDQTTRVTLPGYTTVDLGVHYKIATYRLSLNVENLFDQAYYVGGTNDSRLYTGDPRNIMLSLSGQL